MAVSFNNKNKHLCCGCRGCEQICPQNCISMIEDEEGFLYPSVDVNVCIECGLCVKVCPIRDGGYQNYSAIKEPEVYGAYHKNTKIIDNSTSGGAFSAIVEAFCDENYVVFGAEFDENLVVKHNFVMDKSQISKFRGSKYVQCDTNQSYSKIKQFLTEGKKVLFSGTPCQVAGLRAFLRKDYDNLLCVDIVCHGVPSPKVFELYKTYLTQKYKSDVEMINFRDKTKKDWTLPYVSIALSTGKKIFDVHSDDVYIIGFYKNYYIRPVCHSCPFAKTPRVSDLTIADFWGVEEINPNFKNNNGTSLVLINTNKGEKIYDGLKQHLVLEKANLEDALKFNPQLKIPTAINPMREAFMSDLKNDMNFNDLRKKYLKKRPLIKRLISRVIDKNSKNKIKKLLHIG